MNMQDALNRLRDGYCLWVGAGIPIQLTMKTEKRCISWEELITSLEERHEQLIRNKLPDIHYQLSFPERLGVVLRGVLRHRYAQYIKELILDRLSLAVLDIAERNFSEKIIKVPEEFIQIATLGNLANPIVNFNLETLSSIALAGLRHDQFEVKTFKLPDIDDDFSWPIDTKPSIESYKRHILHPHGSVDTWGRCVLTDKEYSSMDGTLAHQLAVHAAFRSKLAIVGMTLDDQYLREQITQFRQQINSIFWFLSQDEVQKMDQKPEVVKWVHLNNVFTITVPSWQEFWSEIVKIFPAPNKDNLNFSYLSLITQCFDEVVNRGKLINELFTNRKYNFDGSRDSCIRHAHNILIAQHRGESSISALTEQQLNDKHRMILAYRENLVSGKELV